jgi:hypothetical protein
MKNKKEIIFTDMLDFNLYPPTPAKNNIPEWYKNTNTYVNNNEKEIQFKDENSRTIKRCLPVFDALTAGYILYTQADVQVTQKFGLQQFSSSGQNFVGHHPLQQAPLHPFRNIGGYPKFNSPYAITTPPGYSILFLPPMHNPNKIFTIFEGVVDTDTYHSPVLFPFVLNDRNWTGIIPAGTPMAQVIPFKRDSWTYKIGSDKEIKDAEKIMFKTRSVFYNAYRNLFWQKKEYD